MKRFKMKFLSIVLATVIAMVPSGTAFANDLPVSELVQAEVSLNAQSKAVEAYFILRRAFEFDEHGELISYPDGYGGCYINDANELVVLVKNSAGEAAVYQSLFEGVDLPVVFQQCKYSVNEAVADYIEAIQKIEQCDGGTTADEIISMAYYSSRRNTYVVQITQEDEPLVESAFGVATAYAGRNMRDSVTIEIIDSVEKNGNNENNGQLVSEEETIVNAEISSANAYLVAGRELYALDLTDNINGNYTECGTLGISGTLAGMPTTTKYILTAGHVADNNPCLLNNGIYTQLSTYYIQFEDEENYDLGLLSTTSSSYNNTNTVYVDDEGTVRPITKYYPFNDYPEGMIVNRYGIMNGRQTGVIESTSLGEYTYYDKSDIDTDGDGVYDDFIMVDITLKGMIVVRAELGNLLTQDGDSGGPAWFNYNGENVFIGVLSGFRSTTSHMYNYISPILPAIAMGFIPTNLTPLSVSLNP